MRGGGIAEEGGRLLPMLGEHTTRQPRLGLEDEGSAARKPHGVAADARLLRGEDGGDILKVLPRQDKHFQVVHGEGAVGPQQVLRGQDDVLAKVGSAHVHGAAIEGEPAVDNVERPPGRDLAGREDDGLEHEGQLHEEAQRGTLEEPDAAQPALVDLPRDFGPQRGGHELQQVVALVRRADVVLKEGGQQQKEEHHMCVV